MFLMGKSIQSNKLLYIYYVTEAYCLSALIYMVEKGLKPKCDYSGDLQYSCCLINVNVSFIETRFLPNTFRERLVSKPPSTQDIRMINEYMTSQVIQINSSDSVPSLRTITLINN